METELSKANEKIAKLEKEKNEMKKNMIKMDSTKLEISNTRYSALAKLNKLKNKFGQSHEQKPTLENSSVNQI